MSIFDSHSNSALETYDYDGLHVEIGYDMDPIRPSIGEYRLMDREGQALAVGVRGRHGGIDFLYGDKELFNLEADWDNYEADDEYYEKPGTPLPIVHSATGDSQGDEVFVYFPANTRDTEEMRKELTQLNANYVFGHIYLVSVTEDEGEEKFFTIEHADTGDAQIDEFLRGVSTESEVRAIVDEYVQD